MDEIYEKTLLYDFYGELLTEHQKHIYECAVFEDLSLSEIADQEGITRQGVHDMIRRCNKILTEYEEKLQLVAKFVKNRQRAEEILQTTEELLKEEHSTAIQQTIQQVHDTAKVMIEEF